MSALPTVVGAFDRAAATYDHVGVPFFRPIADHLVAALQVRPGEAAVDLGCGRGAVLFALADAVGVDGHVLGLDLSQRMVELTRAGAAELPDVEVRVADASSPGLVAASYDVVASSMVLSFLPDWQRAVHAWVDLLAPGGRLGVTTAAPMDPQWQSLIEPLAGRATPHEEEARSSESAPDVTHSGLERLLAELGLQHVRTVPQTVHAELRDAAHVEAFMRSTVQRLHWEAVPDADLPQVRRALSERVAALSVEHGVLRISQRVFHTVASRSVENSRCGSRQ